MKLISYLHGKKEQLALLVGDKAYNIRSLGFGFPHTMNELLEAWEKYYPQLLKIEASIRQSKSNYFDVLPVQNLHLLAPVPKPGSCRDGYAFRQHVETARRNRGVPMIAAFDEFPVFYFTNHRSIRGPGDIPCMPDHFQKLDFELEVAIVIAKQGKNIKAIEADEYIAGLVIMNDMSARTLQMEEMQLNLGPAKGKDFATAIGPWLVTTDELQAFEQPPKNGHTGKVWNLAMSCTVNGKEVSRGNLADMDWTFAEIIERASYGTDIFPGDIIGSGTVGTGCFLELNGTGKLKDPGYQSQWLQPGDVIEMEITGLGKLQNKVIAERSGWSLLEQKKNHEVIIS